MLTSTLLDEYKARLRVISDRLHFLETKLTSQDSYENILHNVALLDYESIDLCNVVKCIKSDLGE